MKNSEPEKIYNCIQSSRGVSLISKLFLNLIGANRDNLAQLEIERHPLGFLSLKWPIDKVKVLRLHIWDRSFCWAQPENFRIHDHIFDFRSLILIGIIKNTVYSTVGNSRDYSVLKTSYVSGQSILTPASEKIGLRVDREEIYYAGSYYNMEKGVLHETSLESEFGVTALAVNYTPPIKDGARVISKSTSGVNFQRKIIKPSEVNELINVANSHLIRSLNQ